LSVDETRIAVNDVAAGRSAPPLRGPRSVLGVQTSPARPTGFMSGLSAAARDLHSRWRRDASLPLHRRLKKARDILLDRRRATRHLRGAHLGARVRAVGKPIVINHGTLIIGEDSTLRSIVAPIHIYVAPGATMTMGRSVRVNSGDTFAALSRIEIGDRVEIGPHVTIQDNSFHDLYDRSRVPDSRPVIIEDDVWLASNCTVLPGVRIGRGAVVVAHALVTRNVEPFTVVSGVPAQPVAKLNPKKFVVSTGS
jgi:acetyltransferase-like isoleucine patch superfamily enzyme